MTLIDWIAALHVLYSCTCEEIHWFGQLTSLHPDIVSSLLETPSQMPEKLSQMPEKPSQMPENASQMPHEEGCMVGRSVWYCTDVE